MFELGLAQVKQFEFTWAAAMGAEYYQLLESADGEAPFVQVGDDVVGLTTALTVPLYARANARYLLRACNGAGCTDSEVLNVTGNLAPAIGYFKATNTGLDDNFGGAVALSGDGNTLAVSAQFESSGAGGIGGDQADDSVFRAGAVYVYARDGMNAWTPQAYVKALEPSKYGRFGERLALSLDGSTLAVGTTHEAGVGAVYMFVRDGNDAWTQQARLREANTPSGDDFGASVALSADGSTLAVGAVGEAGTGAVYMYARDDMNAWTQQAYVRASNSDIDDKFGWHVALSADGRTLAVGAPWEASSATGIEGDSTDNGCPYGGAVYVYARDGMNAWTQRAYIKASITRCPGWFGKSVALSGDGSIMAVSGDLQSHVEVFTRDEKDAWTQQAEVKASNPGVDFPILSRVALSSDGSTLAVSHVEDRSTAIGIGGDPAPVSGNTDAGATYVFVRDAMSVWTQQAYVKASNTRPYEFSPDMPVGPPDARFGDSVALSKDGSTLAVGAPGETSKATGIGGDQTDISVYNAGAVYLY